ncbi:MAG: stage II sporulation protein M [Anaerolineae bacterium]
MAVAIKRSPLATAWIITQRELHDSLRDWRIVIPVILLTLIFPWLMNFTASVATAFAEKYGAPLIGTRLIPFLLMIVGFFPISFSLVIALETFVGEKERNSLEPLLAMPISDTELYLGKMLAALILPLLASYLGISVYMLGMYWTMDYFPPPVLLVQILLLTTMEAVVMVSGAVVVSSQTTSVRAANLLASFIIIPMAFLVQAESVIMFWGRYEVLWYILLALVVADIILVRMGVRIFNREEILSREIDELNLGFIWRTFLGFFLRPPLPEAEQSPPERKSSGYEVASFVRRVYLHDIPALLRANCLAMVVVAAVLVGGLAVGWLYAWQHPLPPGSLRLQDLNEEMIYHSPNLGFLPRLRTADIFINNVRALGLAAILAIFSFGTLALILLMMPMLIVGFLAGEAFILGHNPLVFTAVFVMPHGFVELPAAIIATAFALRIGASLISPPSGLTVGESLLLAAADFVKVFFFLVIPLLLLAAFLEVNLTPRLVLWVYGG